MKNSTTTPILSLITSLLFLVFTLTTTTTIATISDEIVLDSQGNAMVSGGNYSMLPPVPDLPQRGYGLLADNITDEQTSACSVGVIEPQRQYGGWPVTITALRQQQGDDTNTITTSMPLLFSFPYKYNAKLCNNYSDWVVHRSLIGDDDSLETVMLGYSDHPISDSLFYIRPYDSSEKLYKLVSCHCSVCKHIGIHIDERSKTKRLVVTDGEPLVMRFVNRGRFASEI